MCHFVSWIQKEKTILFLTDNDVFNTKDGKKLQKYYGDSNDLIGHGAIRRFYGNTALGYQKECEDLTDPDNFPKQIQKAIILGKMDRLAKIGEAFDDIYTTKKTKLTREQIIRRIIQALPKDKKVRQAFRNALNKQKRITDNGDYSLTTFINNTQHRKNKTYWQQLEQTLPRINTKDFLYKTSKPKLKPAWRAAKKKLFPKKK